jgi:type IV pilus assembly protein PilV
MLIEALIGILIFSIGILALIGMQGTAVKNATDARFRSDASYLANTIVGQMRLDFAFIDSYKDSATGNYPARTEWRNQVAAALPGIDLAGSVRVPSITVDAMPALTYAGDASPSNRVTVVIRWLQPGETQERQFQVVTYLMAYAQ